ncbi:cytidylyltransferase domain-containing protein [Rubeoparvulum massiliense]|uniref:cytidylyltransferase domain-containing protein n=1 Tax=Rubeoparvulum massiliense TaxID=1631346 RepID=UPI00065DEB36|nr:glycosyltransferase family protein [Rubeoparvulum massiliense]
MGKVIAIIQARMGSTRLPGKVMMKIDGKTILHHVIERVKQAYGFDQIVIATTTFTQDDVIAKAAIEYGVEIYRGSEENVLSRYYEAATKYHADVIVRITSDCPLIDPLIIDQLVQFYKSHDYEMVTNAGIDLSKRTYPRGLDTEVFSYQALKEAYLNGHAPYHREHVTPYIYEKSDKIYYYQDEKNNSQYRWTLDTEEDFRLIQAVYLYLYNGKHDFYYNDILKVFSEHPELIKINAHIEQKKVK